MDSDLEKLLKEYVDPESREKWQKGMQSTVARLFDQALSTSSKIDKGFHAVHLDLALIKKEQALLSERVERLEDADEITEVQQRDKLLGKLKDEREKTQWWQRWVLGIVAALLIALIASGTALAVQALKAPPPAMKKS